MNRWTISRNTWNEAAPGQPRAAVVLRGERLLERPARAAIEDPGNEKQVSHVTAWEVAIKVSLGKLKLGL